MGYTKTRIDQIDLTVTGSFISDHSAEGMKARFIAGATIVFGNVVYMQSAGTLALADATDSGSAPAIGMAMEGASANDPCQVLLVGLARDDSWNWTVGSTIYLSTTAGSMSETAPTATDEVVQVMGTATHADRMLFNPSQDILVHA